MFSYKPLADTLKEKKLELGNVCKEAGLKEGVLICKMNSNEYISMESLDKLCNVLEVPVESIIQWQKGEQKISEKVNVNWELIISLLQSKDMSLNELSEKCRLNRTALSHSKNRNSQLRLRTVSLMARTLGCKVDEILAVNGSASPKE